MSRMEEKIEILAPAGSYDSFVAAINAGADAVYAGGMRFGARAYADNLRPSSFWMQWIMHICTKEAVSDCEYTFKGQ